MTTITLPRATVEQALEAMLNFPDDISDAMFESITALKAALAQKHDPVAHSGWVLREVLFDNGEPIGHREPQHSPAALAQQAEPVAADALTEPKSGDKWRVEWWNESCRMMLPAHAKLDSFVAYKNGTIQFTIKRTAA